MEILIIIVALLLVGGVSSALHGIIKPAVDWVYPRKMSDDLTATEILEDIERIQLRISGREKKRLPLP